MRPRGRLFWKFFLSYWAALLLAIVGVGAASWLYRLREQDLSLEAGPGAKVMLEAAAATLRHGGPAALRAFLAQTGGGRPLFAVDEQGRDLLGRGVPPEALQQARHLVAVSESSEGARRVRPASGESYTLFIPARDAPLLLRVPAPRGRPPSPLLPLAVGTVASLVFGAALAWYLARPIRHLRNAFASLAQGRLDTRVAPLIGRRRDEVADLGRDFDAMAQQLQALMAAQRSLLHDVSHELRSPLARLQAAIGLARQSPERLETSLGRIEREAERVDELVGELLTLSRLEARLAGQPLERSERTDVVELVASIAADAHFEAQASGRAVVFIGEGELLADVRVELLQRAVENVVRNAVKFTAEGTTVAVGVERDSSGDEALVTVADRGPGVAAEELQAIFEPFHKGKRAPAGPGFGLGLAIARRAIEAHGGRVQASNRESGGLLVEIRIPLRVGDHGPAPPSPGSVLS